MFFLLKRKGGATLVWEKIPKLPNPPSPKHKGCDATLLLGQQITYDSQTYNVFYNVYLKTQANLGLGHLVYIQR